MRMIPPTRASLCLLAAAALAPLAGSLRSPASAALAEAASARVWAEELATGLDQPWSMAWLPD